MQPEKGHSLLPVEAPFTPTVAYYPQVIPRYRHQSPADCLSDSRKLGKKINKHPTVFERLTDSTFFTGTHKERFDELGNGRGLAGREYLYVHDGLTESPSRTHEVFSSACKQPRRPVVTPGTLGIQKFGVQIATPKLIWLYRNGDKHHDGTPFFLRSYIKNVEALHHEITKKITPINGPIRKIFDQNLNRVRHLREIVDGAKYLCSSGEPPATTDRLEKFLNMWVIQRPQGKPPTDFYIL